ncbi:MAG: hypothetical protein JWN08_3081 [Frankiales bacterium]|jgi:hypothetical protein|nr:hypothetical protein [Frankiales bacterium]
MDLKVLLKAQWDRATAIGCTVLGALLLLIGWIGVSGSPLLAEQAPYILSGGVGGVFMLGVGATLWISADLRDEWRKLDRIEQALLDGTLRFVDGDSADELPAQRPAARDEGDLAAAPSLVARPHVVLEEQTEVIASPVKPARAARSTATSTAVRPKRSRTGVGHA